MSRSKSLRKELKDQVREELNQEDEKIENVIEDMSSILHPSYEEFANNIIPDSITNLLETRREAARDKVKAILQGRSEPNVSYEESDQSPVKGQEAVKLFTDLSTGLDYSPVYPHLSCWLRTIFCGDYHKFLGFLRGLSEDEVKVLLSKRESMYNVSAIFHVVKGALSLTSDIDHPIQQVSQNFLRKHLDVKDGHLRILIKLLSLGVDVNEKDAFGQTPLFYCIGDGEVVPKIAERLLRAGAKVNAQDRRGKTPLHYHAGSSYIEVMELLLANGADPHIKDNDGETVYDMHSTGIAKDILGRFDKNQAMDERKMSRNAVGGSFRQCGVCGVGVGEKIMKRCSGCYLFWYCGRKCQLDHWPDHQHDCKRIQQEFQTFYVTDNHEKGKNHNTGQVFSRLSGDRPKKSHFVVKVQLESKGKLEFLKVYSEDHLIYGHIIQEYTPSLSKELKTKIKKEGNKSKNCFFYAIIPKDGQKQKNGVNVVEMKINMSKIQPIEGW